MKKRRPCTWNISRSPGNSPTPLHARELDSFPIKTRSTHDLKRRRLQRYGSKLQKKSPDHSEPDFKRDAFGSLESLFDLKKPLNLPEVFSLTVECYQEGHVYRTSEKFKNNKNLVESPHSRRRADLEPHILERLYEVDDHKSKSEETRYERNVETPRESKEIRIPSLVEEAST
ncbi:uncharacterized protein LOC143342848 [Colletes latitarsis]|uniref:uncharacterized protein LOC143342848 n=1 Tax=Colletes latitarsis TaxID=2605962 RepID=UPI00403541FD